jgi:transcription elongation factor GreA
MDANLLTPAGFEKLTSELGVLRAKREALLREVTTGQVGAAVRGARQFDADDVSARLERQIASLEERLALAKVVRPDPADGELGVGERARLRDFDTGELVVYRVVGAGEAEPAEGSISYTSPVGSALVGKRVGDVVEVETPSGLLRMQILEIEI